MGFTKLLKDVLNISKLPDSVKGQSEFLKKTFDQAGADIKEAHNKLIDELAEQNAASNIGALSEEGATTVQEELNKLNDRIRIDFTELEVIVDDEINEESENAIQNKVVAKEVKKLQGNLYTFDRYNKCSVKATVIENGILTRDILKEVKMIDYKNCKSLMAEVTCSGTYSNSSSYYLSNAFDGSSSSYWYSTSSTTPEFKIKFKEAIKIKKLKTYITSNKTDYFANAVIQGSNDEETWTNLHTITAVQAALTEITLDKPDYYLFYRVVWTHSTATNAKVFEFNIIEWEGNYYDYCLYLEQPLTKYEENKIINIECEEYTENETAVTLFENPYININNLGAKQINGTIVAGEKYSLIYNDEIWDILPKDYVTGNYTGTTEVNSSGTQKITLGFRPKIVIVYCAEYGFVDLGADEWYGAIALEGYPALDGGVSGHPAYLTITETGFEAKSTSYNARLNYKNFNYRYIAFK